MGFNFVDIVVLFFAIFFLWQGYQYGFIAGVLNLVVTIVAIFLATFFYPQAGDYLVKSFNWGTNISAVVAFFGILIITELILGFLSNRVYSYLSPYYKKIELISKVDKFLGVFPSLVVGIFLLSLILFLPLILPVKDDLKNPIQESWWGKNVLTLGFKYQPQFETLIGKLPYKNLAYLITPEPDSTDSVELNIPQKVTFAPDPTAEESMFNLVNQERLKRGISVLTFRRELRDVGRAHCLDMFKKSYFSHYTLEGLSPFDRMDEAGITYKVAGENLAYAPSVKIAHEGLMNSKGHRENILRVEFGRLGVGVIDGGINGKMFCQEYSD